MSNNTSMPDMICPPRIRIVPPYSIDLGQDAIDLGAAYGLPLDDWQQDVLRAWLGTDETGKFTATSAGVLVPRQNGKNAILEVRELYGSLILGETILHTSQETRTALEQFERLKVFFGDGPGDPYCDYPEINAMVAKVRSVNGQQSIILKNGGRILFATRTGPGMRGLTVDLTVYDEAAYLTPEQLSASLPARTAAPLGNPQTIYTGTPPTLQLPAIVLSRVRDSALLGEPRIAWHEWSIEDITGLDIADDELIKSVNPAIPHRVDIQTIKDDFAQMPPTEFAIEHLCWWPRIRVDTLIKEAEWNACIISEARAAAMKGDVTFAIKFSPDGRTGAIACCLNPRDDKTPPLVELYDYVEMYDGLGGFVALVEQVQDIATAVIIDGAANASALTTTLKDMTLRIPSRRIKTPRPNEVATACSMFYNAVLERKLSHAGYEQLTETVIQCKRRPIGTTGAWGYVGISDEIDATITEAAALAYWGSLTTRPRKPKDGKKKRRVITS